MVVLPQAAGDQAVDTNAQANGQGNHQRLHREGQGHGGKGIGVVLGNEDAVHHVVQGLHQHGDHNRYGDFGYQLFHGHFAQKLGASLVFHDDSHFPLVVSTYNKSNANPYPTSAESNPWSS